MPEMPTYNSKRSLATQPIDIRRESNLQFQGEKKLAETVSAEAKEWQIARDTMKATNAMASMTKAKNEINGKAATDTGITLDDNGQETFKDNSEKYLEELHEAQENALANITNKRISAELRSQFDLEVQISSINIQTDFNKKELSFNKSQVPTVLEANQKIIVDPNSTDWQVEQAKETQKAFLDAQVLAGVLTPTEADTALDDAELGAVRFEIYNDISTSESESALLKELRDPKGRYGYLPTDTRRKLIKESQDRIFRNNQTEGKIVKQEQKDRNSEFVSKLIDGTASFTSFDHEERVPESEGGIPRKTLMVYQGYLERGVDKTLNQYLKETTPDKEPTKRAKLAEEYLDLMNKYMDPTTEYWEAKTLLAEGLKDGRLDKEELKILEPFKDKLEDIHFNNYTGPINSAIKQIKEWTGSQNKTSEETALEIKNLILGIGEGKNPQDVTRQIISEDMLKFYPDIDTYSTKGKLKQDEDGNQFRVYPDKTWEWVDNAKTK